jgi:ribose transport system ATP-binding protein
MTAEVALSIENASKTFSGVTALSEVSLALENGSIHALLGQNGAGKSTLVKILSGYYAPDHKTVITLWGKPVRLTPRNGPSQGIGIVHQEIPFESSLPVVDNLGAGAHYDTLRCGMISWRRELRDTTALLAEFGVDIDPRAQMSSATPAQRSMLNVIRALRGIREHGHERCVLVLDEPTSYLAQSDAVHLLGAMRKLADQGSSILIITHRLREALAWADHISVLRSGSMVGSQASATLDEAALESMMFGVDAGASITGVTRTHAPQGVPVLEAKGISGRRVNSVSFKIWPGMVTGFSGLAGMGQDELPYLIYGAEAVTAGEIYLDGRKWKPSPGQSVRNGVMFVPGNRQESLWAGGSLLENLTIGKLPATSQRGVIMRRAERSKSRATLESFRVTPSEPRAITHTLSGGNQQKVALARILSSEPKLVLLHEPTQGVDASASREILALAAGAAARGAAVAVFSSDADELAQICSEVSILCDGSIATVLRGDEVTEDSITVSAQRARSVPSASGLT